MKKLWLGILAITLVFGMTLVGCGGDDSTGGDNGKNGNNNNGNNNNNNGGGSLPTTGPLKDKLDWLKANAQSDTTYLITVDQDETLKLYTFSYDGRTNITIHLEGTGGGYTLSSSSSTLFYVESYVTLILENITLQGKSDNTSRLVTVRSNGALEMRTGAKITGNVNTSGPSAGGGGGVYIGGTFTMNGGEISGNTAYHGGGVYVNASGTFTMNDGEISGNTAHAGGGVFYDGTFIMNGGKISGNSADDDGGGVYNEYHIDKHTMTMNGGEISGNTAIYGGGVYISRVGTFTMTGGQISGNTASFGDAVYVHRMGEQYGKFIKSGGTITGSTVIW